MSSLPSFQRLSSWLLLVCLFITEMNGQFTENGLELDPRQSPDGFVDTTACFAAMTQADQDGNEGIEREEYVTFVQLLSPEGLLPNVTEFADLPLLVRSTYFFIACLCTQRGGDSTCCLGDNASIDISGAQLEQPTVDQASYLFLTCWQTTATIDRVESDLRGPTLAPTNFPTLGASSAPSPSPTKVVSAAPTIAASQAPTSSSSQTPTVTSSHTPTSIASQAPSSAPSSPGVTASPTAVDSDTPTVVDSESPTVLESDAPTHSASPSASPTELASKTPTETPTLVASDNPTAVPSLIPTMVASSSPTISPSEQPSQIPTVQASVSPTVVASTSPTLLASVTPTEVSSAFPTVQPSAFPSEKPSESPSEQPSESPSKQPSESPSKQPSVPPTLLGSSSPTATVPTGGAIPGESVPSFSPSPSQTPSPSIPTSSNPTPVSSATDKDETEIPSVAPSLFPTDSPSEYPSDVPSEDPSEEPSELPSTAPTLAPTNSTAPSVAPSVSEAPSTSSAPSPVPSTSPSMSPSTAPSAFPSETVVITDPPVVPLIDAVGRATYTINVVNGKAENIPSSEYIGDLIGAMDIVAVEIAEQVDEILGRRRLLRTKRRKLEILVDLPTSIDSIIDAGGFTTDPAVVNGLFTMGACPAELGNPQTDRCEEVTAAIDILSMGKDPIEVQILFQTELNDAIMSGRLQQALDVVNPDSVIQVLSGREASEGVTANGNDDENGGGIVQTPSDENDGEGLSSGATTGIVLASLALTCVLASFCFASRRRDEKAVESEIQPLPAGSGLEWGVDDNAEKAGRGDIDPTARNYAQDPSYAAGGDRLGATPLAHSQPGSSQELYGQQTSFSGQSARDDSGSLFSADYSGSGKRDAHSAKSSERSEAGWSDLYASSMGTMESDELMPGAQRESGDMQAEAPSAGITNIEDLEAAITSGDWAAVGASAALLAASQYDGGGSESLSKSLSKSKSTFSNFSSVKSNSSKWNTGLDAKKAAELDQLIETGNWEGVIQAAAKFEAEANLEVPSEMHSDSGSDAGDSHDTRSRQSSSVSQPSRQSSTASQPSIHHTSSGSATGSATPTLSTSTISLDTAKQKSREQIRAEVVELVERVVPEELDHVDEMMAQFLGREEELLETLKTMQERDIAQKSRRAEQRKAKLETSDQTERDQRRVAAIQAAQARIPQQRPGGPIFVAADESPSETTNSGSSGAVANAASLQSEQTEDAANLLTSASSSSDDRTRHRNALYAAIDAGQWDAVGEAAAILSGTDSSRLQATFESSRSGSTSDTRMRSRREEMTDLIERGDWLGVVVAASRYSEADQQAAAGMSQNQREQQLREEKEARRQAAMWMEIAKQSKAAGTEEGDDTGAADAADWAIAQSLRRLEQQKKDRQQDSDLERGEGDQSV